MTRQRKFLADVLVPPIDIAPDEITRIRGWFCFLTAIALLYGILSYSFWLLFFALILDSVDGAVARRQGLDCPQTDRAMDIFTSFMLCASYLIFNPTIFAQILMLLWILPKCYWLWMYVNRLSGRRFGFRSMPLRWLPQALYVFLYFPFSHILLILIFIQWVLKCHIP
jgi:phosphatidylglycerophosphate synthase